MKNKITETYEASVQRLEKELAAAKAEVAKAAQKRVMTPFGVMENHSYRHAQDVRARDYNQV
jgi:hypothetical protein|tara:strand:+ start:1427 stop:1612 length:186 start_codon:yes stop_codon:yes gene_type:complete